MGSRGLPERVLLPFARAKGSPRRIGVQTKLSKRLCDAVRRHWTITLLSADNPSVTATPCQLLAAARSRRGSDMPPAYHSLPRRHFVTLYTREPNLGRGEWDAELSAACGRCSEAEHPQRSKKPSKRAARRFFRAPQGGRSGNPICPAAGGDGNGNLRKTEELEGGYYGKEKRAGEGPGRPVFG